MARGWESKSVEEQIEAAEERRLLAEKAEVTQEATRVQSAKESLQLSLERIDRELAATTHDRRRAQLLEAQAFLQKQLADLQ